MTVMASADAHTVKERTAAPLTASFASSAAPLTSSPTLWEQRGSSVSYQDWVARTAAEDLDLEATWTLDSGTHRCACGIHM